MKSDFFRLLAIGVGQFLLFVGVFFLMQQEAVYQNTLGLISQNYERIGGWNDYEIKRVSKPYNEIRDNDFITWDAAIYSCISERFYEAEDDCYGHVRGAFFPLFPALWRLTNGSPITISVVNYGLFTFALTIFAQFMFRGPPYQKYLVFAVAISFPAVVVFFIPYSEGLFAFTMALAVIGLIKRKFALYFLGILLMSMTRPAILFVGLAFFLAELMIFLNHGTWKIFVKEVSWRMLPFVIGFSAAILIQDISSGSWLTLFEAREHWGGFTSFKDGFKDWSVEGFGLSVFAIFFVGIPSIAFLIYCAMAFRKSEAVKHLFANLERRGETYLFVISVFYMLGLFIYSYFLQGVDLHSLSRYILASPFFFMAVFWTASRLENFSPVKFWSALLTLGVLLLFFMMEVDYGGDKWRFPLAGCYLSVVSCYLLAFIGRSAKSGRLLRTALTVVILIANTFWNTYLLNAFLSNAWVFT